MKQKIITIIITLITILAPILIIPDKNNYNMLKFIFLLISGLLLLILLLASYKTLKIDKKDIVILIFLGLVFLSTFMSDDIKNSIFGFKNRYEGLLMFITYTCIYLCSKKYFKYEKLRIFFNIIFIVALIIGVLGIMQKYIKYMPLYPIFNKRICATFGNSNFFGSYISIILPIAIAIFILNNSKKGFILSLIMFFNLISSGTRSAWVAFCAIGILGVIYLIKQKNIKYYRNSGILLICFIIIFIFLYNGFGITKGNLATSIKINQLKDDIINATKDGISDNMGTGRILIWKICLKLMIKKPILGCGPDNLWSGIVNNCSEDAYNFAKQYNAEIDKAHNEYIQIGATIGIPALICYLTFIGLILIPKFKFVNNNNNAYFIICISIISYLVQAFFNISTIGVAPIFWLLLGLIDNKDFINKFNKILKIY